MIKLIQIYLNHHIVKMTEERKKILDKINLQIDKLRNNLLDKFPAIHEIDDGIIIRFFTDWDCCDDNSKIRYKRIINEEKPEEKTIFMYLPKGAYFQHMKRDYVDSVICLSGEIELNINNEIVYIEKYTKKRLISNEFHGRVLENTYLIASNAM